MYYAKGWGLVKWELYHNNAVKQTSTFNNTATTAPIAPNLSVACKNTPAPRNIPAFPTTQSGFVKTLYSCVLNVETPDTEGFNFWLNDLKRHAVTVQGVYTDFFKYQDKSVTDDQFTRQLYACMLFRDVDETSHKNLMDGLAKGSSHAPAWYNSCSNHPNSRQEYFRNYKPYNKTRHPNVHQNHYPGG